MASIVSLDKRTHVLTVPDMYIGAPTGTTVMHNLYVYNPETTAMDLKDNLTVVPSVLKLFDEALVNSADHCKRGSATKLTVRIHPSSNEITVSNNGTMIPLTRHTTIKSLADPSGKDLAYNWELAFFHPMSSSNFERTDKTIGSRFGLGIKIASIFSTRSCVTVCDGTRTYTQRCRDNMAVIDPPRIADSKGDPSLTFTFCPDWNRLCPGVTPADAYAMMMPIFRTRVYELAGSLPTHLPTQTATPIKLWYAEGSEKLALIKQRGFKELVKLFHSTASLHHDPSGWDVGICSYVGPTCSLVNHIHTYQGGSHEEYIRRQIHTVIKQKYPDAESHKLSGYYTLVIHATIENPSFSSQSKEQLKTPVSQYGTSCDLDPAWIDKQLIKFGIKDRLAEDLKGKRERAANKSIKSSDSCHDIDHYIAARWAGTKHASQAILFLTEGVSALTLVNAAIEVKGEDRIGGLALRGVGINADRTEKNIMDNEEVTNIRRVLGLKFNTSPTPADLRYGRVVIMADQDKDGAHIIGLLVFLFKRYWPSLLEHPSFLSIFVTPLIIVRQRGVIHRMFFTMTEYDHWVASLPHAPTPAHGYHIKYYKGLGTSTNKEAAVYFKAFDHHLKPFEPLCEEDKTTLEMAFASSQSDARKDWLRGYDPTICVPYDTVTRISIREFIRKVMIHFSWLSVHRSIPLIEDGMTPAQRKCLWTLMDLKIDSYEREEKVASLQGKIASATMYAHGADSLSSTMISMAQVYTGVNNIALLVPSGQFGTRKDFGKETAASPRYISTYLSSIVPKLFRPEDRPILTLLSEEGVEIEPVSFAPILPMILVNDSANIGTGWCTRVPSFKPEDLITRLKHKLGAPCSPPPPQWIPYYEGFTGTITPTPTGYISEGVVKQDTTLDSGSTFRYVVTEVPVHTSLDKYKKVLLGLPGVEVVKPQHRGDHVRFEVETSKPVTEWKLKESRTHQLNLLGLRPDRRTETMMTLNTMDEIFDHFFQYRYHMYQKRLAHQQRVLDERIQDRRYRLLFVRGWVDGTLSIVNRAWTDVTAQLISIGLPLHTHEAMVNMNIRALTSERIRDLEHEVNTLERQLVALKQSTVEQVWLAELDELERVLPAYWKARREWITAAEESPSPSSSSSSQSVKKRAVGKVAPPQAKALKPN
jgi:DNA topoisomerase-2